MTSDRIKSLWESNNLTQSELARKLGLSRAGVNAWEMGIAVPSTHYIKELALLFHVSSDYLLGIDGTDTIDASGLADEDKDVLIRFTQFLRTKNQKLEQKSSEADAEE